MTDDVDNNTTQRVRHSRASRHGDGASLVVISGPALGQRIDLADIPTVIGRSSSADVQIEHKSVSRQHCTVWREGERYFVRDLGSTNQTLVDGRGIGEAELSDGDLVTVGEVVMKLVRRDSHEARYHDALYQLATVDSLTGLLNRRKFRELLESAVIDAQATASPLCLTLIDLDHFKSINDRHGHPAGDEVLRAAAAAVARELAVGEVAGRLGGEEFAVIHPQTALSGAVERAEAMRRAVAGTRALVEGTDVRISASLGVAAFDPKRQTASDLLHAADAELLRAKASGRNRVCFLRPD